MRSDTAWGPVARRIADEVLFPQAMRVDRADRVPAEQLDLLATEGFYGVRPPEIRYALVETLASGCLATAFVWMQHHGAVLAAERSDRPGIRDAWLEPLSRGERRAGLAYAALRPGPPSVRARAVPGGYLFDGEAPWVTGWDMIDTLYATARDDTDTVIYALLDAQAGPTLTVEPLDLVAVNASRTVLLRFHEHFVPEERVTGTAPHAEVLGADAGGLRGNGSLSLGLIDRCCRLIGQSPLDAELDGRRAELDRATAGRPLRLGASDAAPRPGSVALPAARAAAAELALRAAAALTVSAGSRSVLRDQHPQRLVREAAFLLVFGSRPAIRDNLLERLR